MFNELHNNNLIYIHPLEFLNNGAPFPDFTSNRISEMLYRGQMEFQKLQAREIKRSFATATGLFMSKKEGGMPKAWESPLEQALYAILDFDPLVKSFQPQPVEINYIDPEGKDRVYYPDALVWFESGRPFPSGLRPLLLEVKKAQSIIDEGPLREMQTKAGQTFASSFGWEFKLFSEADIYVPYWQNAKFLRRFIGYRMPVNCVWAYDIALMMRMNELGSATICDLLDATIDEYWSRKDPQSDDKTQVRLSVMPCLYQLIATGVIVADLSKLLTPKSVVKSAARAREEKTKDFSIFT